MQWLARGSLYLPSVSFGIERNCATHGYGLAVGVCCLLCATHEVSLYVSLCDNFVQLVSGIGYAIFPTCWNLSCGANDYYVCALSKVTSFPTEPETRQVSIASLLWSTDVR